MYSTWISPTIKVTAMAICSFTDSVLSLHDSINSGIELWLVKLLTDTGLDTLTHVVTICTLGDFRPFSMADPIIRQATAKVPIKKEENLLIFKKRFFHYWIVSLCLINNRCNSAIRTICSSPVLKSLFKTGELKICSNTITGVQTFR